MAKIIIPTPLRKFTGNEGTFETKGNSIQIAVEELVTENPDLKKHILNEDGSIRSFIRIYVGEDDINSLEKEATIIDENSVVSIVPAIAGGSF